ncbi:kinase-like protein [Rhizopogon vinicolor AM-OR11-026]|uniref:Kinase-like protein n=1 Tax=Rhizopogon vinicolor AM-OR11-026 TaxID=1314800 RepID=A0A1B7MID8_9AGAM|nr:kinase-like protein [Rhizopogon vinicolor AM-OR11-026]
MITLTPCSMSNLTGKIRKVNLSGGGRSAVVCKATYSTEQSESQNLLVKANAWIALKHVNVLTPIGYVDGFGPLPSIVYEWMPGGILPTYLQNHPELNDLQRLRLMEQIASGLCHLHYKRVIHGNLYGNNILIDANGVPYLADYELTGACRAQYLPESVRWTAPERFDSHSTDGASYPPTTKSDVYSLGGVMYQIVTGRPPYYEVKSRSKVSIKILDGTKPSRPLDLHIADRYWLLIEQCWLLPEDRPSAAQVLHFAQTEVNLSA